MIVNSDKIYFFSLNEPYHQCQALYSGTIPYVILTAETGERVQVPAGRLRQFIDSRGVCGRFRMVVSAQNKIKSFERIR
ncbi:DUF2835 family protein [Alteromonas gilva]|uniref:DUF2835 family protein n=1 Tax=Alteromonas gilva TaxID=2987522 RepID=A0ABT5L2E2_9ALTE|nr:DUF2835 family protein [Alteromonas gilva]MDC8831043.1 DUF2835 family protein [Alteromonas gilva]